MQLSSDVQSLAWCVSSKLSKVKNQNVTPSIHPAQTYIIGITQHLPKKLIQKKSVIPHYQSLYFQQATILMVYYLFSSIR